MDKKPVKRNENILRLSKEHHFSLLFCWKIRQGIKNGIATNRIVKYVEYFTTHFLFPHFREEELFLFTSLDDRWVEKAIEQHKQINNLLAELSNDTKGNSNVQLEKIANLVDDHVRYEERQLFPHMEKALTKEQLQAIGIQLNAGQALPKDEYGDEFWIKK